MPAEDNHALVAELVATHGKQLNRFLVARVRNVSDVPDIAQEVYLRMLRVQHIESVRSPEAYLFTVAQHVVHQHLLRQSAVPPSVELSLMLDQPHASPDADPRTHRRCAGMSRKTSEHARSTLAQSPRHIHAPSARRPVVRRNRRAPWDLEADGEEIPDESLDAISQAPGTGGLGARSDRR